MRKNLTELASKSDLIPGIYNYCDRWCERCQFTARCLVFATDSEGTEPADDSCDSRNEELWEKVAHAFDEAQVMLAGLMAPTSHGFSGGLNERSKARKRRQTASAEKHTLTKAGRDYAAATAKWFSELATIRAGESANQTTTIKEQSESLKDAIDIIEWYQYQIAVKILRALSSRTREADFGEFDAEEMSLKDSDGSAKVALVGVDRSIGAWRLIQSAMPENSDRVVPILIQLDRLGRQIEEEFPVARDFVRPGFDE